MRKPAEKWFSSVITRLGSEIGLNPGKGPSLKSPDARRASGPWNGGSEGRAAFVGRWLGCAKAQISSSLYFSQNRAPRSNWFALVAQEKTTKWYLPQKETRSAACVIKILGDGEARSWVSHNQTWSQTGLPETHQNNKHIRKGRPRWLGRSLARQEISSVLNCQEIRSGPLLFS